MSNEIQAPIASAREEPSQKSSLNESTEEAQCNMDQERIEQLKKTRHAGLEEEEVYAISPESTV